jgi:5'-3' exonuclease
VGVALKASAGPLLVVDAPSLLFRGFFALPKSITDGDGHSVNALLGTANMVLRVVADHEPRAVVMAFGPDAAPYRVELYAGYHADRPPVPDELEWQWARSREFFEALGWVVVHDDSVEADDLLGSYAATEAEAGGSALILTGDRDMYQCAGPDVTVLYIKTGKGVEEVTREEVVRRYGVLPEQVPDFIALRGDPSDGIPGAKGIGEKTAGEILRVHGDLETAIANAAQERPKVTQALRNQADELREFRKIATLQPIPVTWPSDAPTTFGTAAQAASARGMGRLAARLEQLAKKE